MKNNIASSDVVIIGGGASGMMAAIVALRNGKTVSLIEKNDELGKKLSITGGGRCNIFNLNPNKKELLSSYGQAEKFLHSPFSEFDEQDCLEFFRELGIEVKVEDRWRAFPVSEKATDVRDALKREMYKYSNLKVYLNTCIRSISVKDDLVSHIVSSSRELGQIEFVAKDYILSTGGLSKPETGSTGDGFRILADIGINILPFTPTLVPLLVKESYIKSLSGQTLKDLKVNIFVNGQKRKVLVNKSFNIENDINILCTHFGISGPSIINNSKIIKDFLEEGLVELYIDLFKDFNERDMDKYLLAIFENNKNKKLKNILSQIHESKVLSELLETDLLEREVNDIRREERVYISKILKNLKVTVTGLAGYDKAIIADGGVDLKEVNFQNMSLFKFPNLRITGDLLNIYRSSGGYSLLLSWVTGYISAKD